MLKIEFINKLPAQVPPTLKVLSLPKVKAEQGVFKKIVSGLGPVVGFDGFRWKNNAGWTEAESKDSRVSINHRSGAVRFWTRLNDRELSSTTFSIEEPQLVIIARTFLKKTEWLDTPTEQLKVRHISYLRLQTASVAGKVSTPRILDAGVIFGRDIDGVPVSGPGGYVMVNIAPDKSVIAGTKVWRRLGTSLGTAKVLTPDYAVKEFSRRLNLAKIDLPVRVVKAEFCYFERGQNDDQQYLEPAYAFVYEYETVNRFPHKSAMVIPAIMGSRQSWSSNGTSLKK
jgi:hypothetical protein